MKSLLIVPVRPEGRAGEAIKRCFKCGETRPLEMFYRHAAMADGHLGKCKECAKRDVRERYAATIDQKHEYERARNRTQARRTALGASLKKHRAANPEKNKARAAIAYALKRGTLTRQPCVRCGAKAQAHHEDYAKPLDIMWLCFRHHREHHGQTVAE